MTIGTLVNVRGGPAAAEKSFSRGFAISQNLNLQREAIRQLYEVLSHPCTRCKRHHNGRCFYNRNRFNKSQDSSNSSSSFTKAKNFQQPPKSNRRTREPFDASSVLSDSGAEISLIDSSLVSKHAEVELLDQPIPINFGCKPQTITHAVTSNLPDFGGKPVRLGIVNMQRKKEVTGQDS